MQAIIFTGIQASGKTTFYKEYFFNTHVRISLDLLKTRHREKLFLESCLRTQQRFVIENTNPTPAERQYYITQALAAGFEVIGYYFEVSLEDALIRNAERTGKQKIPERGLYGTQAKLQPPSWEEGYHQLYTVHLHNYRFTVEPLTKPDP